MRRVLYFVACDLVGSTMMATIGARPSTGGFRNGPMLAVAATPVVSRGCVVGRFGEIRQLLQRLAVRRGGSAGFELVVLNVPHHVNALVVAFGTAPFMIVVRVRLRLPEVVSTAFSFG